MVLHENAQLSQILHFGINGVMLEPVAKHIAADPRFNKVDHSKAPKDARNTSIWLNLSRLPIDPAKSRPVGRELFKILP
jgi:hypothetical protein